MKLACSAMALAFVQLLAPAAYADAAEKAALLDRIEKLEAANARLMAAVEGLIEDAALERVATVMPTATAVAVPATAGACVGMAPDYGYAVLDHAEAVNKKRILQLRSRQNGRLKERVTLSGQATVLADYQSSNRADKFGYLMRHLTLSNQIGDQVSEAVIHSASLAATAALTDNITAYIQMLYSPEQSFGAGTLTALGRNQAQVRSAYLMWGNLDKSPVYASIGKMYTPLGLNDTVGPFTNSTVWHAFAGLAYGAEVGCLKDGLSLRAVAIQGGAQFRGANTPVDGTNVPSRLNNSRLMPMTRLIWVKAAQRWSVPATSMAALIARPVLSFTSIRVTITIRPGRRLARLIKVPSPYWPNMRRQRMYGRALPCWTRSARSASLRPRKPSPSCLAGVMGSERNCKMVPVIRRWRWNPARSSRLMTARLGSARTNGCWAIRNISCRT